MKELQHLMNCHVKSLLLKRLMQTKWRIICG